MEVGNPTVSLDLLIGAHLTLGAKRAEIGRYLTQELSSLPNALASCTGIMYE
jgi:hypothetical protein